MRDEIDEIAVQSRLTGIMDGKSEGESCVRFEIHGRERDVFELSRLLAATRLTGGTFT